MSWKHEYLTSIFLRRYNYLIIPIHCAVIKQIAVQVEWTNFGLVKYHYSNGPQEIKDLFFAYSLSKAHAARSAFSFWFSFSVVLGMILRSSSILWGVYLFSLCLCGFSLGAPGFLDQGWYKCREWVSLSRTDFNCMWQEIQTSSFSSPSIPIQFSH